MDINKEEENGENLIKLFAKELEKISGKEMRRS